MSIPKVKIAVLKNLLIFGEKYLPQSVRLLEGGGLKRYLAEFRLNMHHPCVGLPLVPNEFELFSPVLPRRKRQFAVSVSRRYFALIALSILESCMSGLVATN